MNKSSSGKLLHTKLSKAPRKFINSSFKSPVRTDQSCSRLPKKDSDLSEDILKIKEKIKIADVEIESLNIQGFKNEELDNHIKLLHDYNEIKDIGQMLLGRLAVQKALTTTQIYAEYGLDIND